MIPSENAKQRSVIVVGAGPVGMTAALALRKYDIPVTILEADPEGRSRPGSRAIFIHKETLKLLEEIYPGLGFTLAEEGLIWPVKRTFFRGKEVYRRQYAPPDPKQLPPLTSLPQVNIERFLYDACQKADVEFVWNTPVRDVRADERGVVMETESGEVWKAEYVIGADGARSTVRKSVGIKMEGSRSENAFIVVDVKEDEKDPLPLERVFHYQHPNVGGRNVLLVPFTGGWRIDLQLFEDDDPETFSGVEGVKKWLPKVMDAKYADRVTWVSTYQFLQVVAERFADEHYRVLLTGEAAHLFAPFGARGLNSGVPDAISSAKAIHTALTSHDAAAAQQAVMLAAEKRKKAALHNRDAAGIALKHIQGNSLEMRFKRVMAASLASVWPNKFGRWLDEGPYGPKSGPPSLNTKY